MAGKSALCTLQRRITTHLLIDFWRTVCRTYQMVLTNFMFNKKKRIS